MHGPFDKPFQFAPCPDLDLWPFSRSNLLPRGGPQFSEFACPCTFSMPTSWWSYLTVCFPCMIHLFIQNLIGSGHSCLSRLLQFWIELDLPYEVKAHQLWHTGHSIDYHLNLPAEKLELVGNIGSLLIYDGTCTITGAKRYGWQRKRLVWKHPWFSLLIALFILFACWCTFLYRSKWIYKIIFICLLVVSLISQRDELCICYTYHVQIKSAVIRTIYTGYTYHSHF